MLLVSDVVATRIDLPSEFLSLIPSICPTCSSPTAIRPSFTGLSCIDPRCPDKVASRVVDICKRMGVLGVGQKVAEKFVATYRLRNPLLILCLGDESQILPIYTNAPENLTRSIHDQVLKFRQSPMTLVEFVNLAYLPGIQSSAEVIFKGYEDIHDFYASFDKHGYSLIHSRLQITAEFSQRAYAIAHTLAEFKGDLLEAWDWIDHHDVSQLKELRVVISDSAGEPFLSKRDFMNQVNSLAPSLGYHITFATSVTRSIDVLVHAGGRYTNKLAKAEQYGKPIMTGSEFVTAIQGGTL